MSTQEETTLTAKWENKLAESKVPEHIRNGLVQYLVRGLQPGHFLTAVLENNLIGAMYHADETNSIHIKDIVGFMYMELPTNAWGNKDKVKAWMEEGYKDEILRRHYPMKS